MYRDLPASLSWKVKGYRNCSQTKLIKNLIFIHFVKLANLQIVKDWLIGSLKWGSS